MGGILPGTLEGQKDRSTLKGSVWSIGAVLLLALCAACAGAGASGGSGGSTVDGVPGGKCPTGRESRGAGGAKLVVSERTVSRTGVLWARILNRGDHLVSFGVKPTVQMCASGVWRRVAIESDGLPMAYGDELVSLGSGGRSAPIEIPVGDRWLAGRYRVAIPISIGRSRGAPVDLLTAPFRVR